MEFENEIVENNGTEETTPPVDTNNDLDGESELMEALKSLKGETEDDDLEDSENDNDDEPPAGNEDDELDNEDDNLDDADPETKAEPEKKVQSKEENAKFAAQRRQQELQAKVNEELERLKSESPEFKLAQQLSELYGVPADELVKQMQEATLQKEAKDKGIPLEYLRQQHADREKVQSLEQELNMMRYNQWQSKVQTDANALKTDYPMLTDDDMDAAVDYILKEARNVEMPLEQAVYALHGKKIIDSLAKAKTQDNLAAESGRKKKAALPPNNGKPSTPSKSLTAEEKYIAKQLGLTADDYLQYKS